MCSPFKMDRPKVYLNRPFIWFYYLYKNVISLYHYFTDMYAGDAMVNAFDYYVNNYENRSTCTTRS